MIPRLAAAGTSFQGAYLYYAHDKGAKSQQRIGWTYTINMMTDSIAKAWKVQAYTAKHQERLKEASGQSAAGAKLKKPVMSYSIAWHPEQKPSPQEMQQAVDGSVESLGLSEHESWAVEHRDRDHPHVHVIINTVNPLSGRVAKLSHTKRKIQDWAREYEREHGKIYCQMREDNYQKRKRGQTTKYANPVIADAWEQTTDATSFAQALEAKGYQLARGRKRLVVVDPYGKTLNPTRELSAAFGKGAPKAFRERMAGLEQEKLPTPEAVIEQRANEPESDRAEESKQKKLAPQFNAQAKKDERRKPRTASNDNEKTSLAKPQKAKKVAAIKPATRADRTASNDNDPAKVPRPSQEKPPEKTEAASLDPELREQLEKKLKRHHERAARVIARTQSAHHEQRSDLEGNHHRTIEKKRAELTTFYDLDGKDSQIKQLEHRLENPGFLRKLTGKLFGSPQKTVREIEQLRAGKENATQRFNEQIGTLEKQRDQAVEQLEKRQTKDRERLTQRFKQMEPTAERLRDEWSHAASRKSPSRDRGREGPSLSR